jgi:hypothetical protein
LSNLAKALFSISVSSVPSECLFSHAGQTSTYLRNRLDSDNLEMLVFIKDNLD